MSNENSRTLNSVKNVISNFSYQILLLLLGFVSRTVFLRILSIEYLGIQGLFSDILNLLSMADLGFNTAMTFSLYKPLANNDKKKISGLITFYQRVYRIIASSIFILGISVIPFLKYIINLETDLPHIKLYYFLYLLNTVASYLVVYKTTILQADQKAYIVTKYSSFFSTLQTISMLFFLWVSHDFLVYLCVQVVFTYLTNFYISSVASKMYPYINEKVKLSKSQTKGIFDNIKSVFIYKVSSVLINATDNTLISVIVGTVATGLYSNYTMITVKLTSLINTVFYSLTSSLGNLIVKEGKEKRYQIFQVLQTISNIFSIICVTMVLFLVQDFIKLWLGSKYLLDNMVLYAIVLNFYFSISLLPIWVYREATGLYNQIKYVMLSTAIINLFISIFLGNFIGLPGILFATSISRVVTYFWYEPILLFNKFFGHSSRIYFVAIMKSLGVLTIVIILGSLISMNIVVNSFIILIYKFFALLFVSSGVSIIFYRNSDGFKYMKQKLIERFS
ncbi:Membrane protein involved in the export of O-antigen and teichoic acid [Streptococcus equinus]|nr:Membrane protein involved in the export of O-antigen and teichoic acid [Streptococcus equinus]